jgi:DNA-binding NarL/FixJ family response regulator
MTSLRGDVAAGAARALEPDEPGWAAADRASGAGEHTAASPRPTVLIVDRLATRVGIRLALGEEAEICVDVADAEQAIRAAKREQPDVCLVGDGMAGDELAAVRGICRAAPHASVVVLVQDPDVDFLLDAVRAGAIGYVPGPLDAEELRRVVKAAAAKEAVVPRSMVLELLLEVRGRGSGADVLTARESQVLGLIRRGHSTSEIAARLAIAPVTVRRHASELVRKLGVADRAALVARAARPPRVR